MDNCINCPSIIFMTNIFCKICNQTFENMRKLNMHIVNFHNMTGKAYYDLYLKIPGEDICSVCGKPTKFNSFESGYRKTCSKTCSNRSGEQKEKYRKTCMEKYGTTNFSQTSQYKEKFKNTCLARYGVENPGQVDEIKQKIRITYDKNHPVKAVINDLRTPMEKQKDTLLKKYGVDSTFKVPQIREKIKNTLMEHYGVENPFQAEEVKNKIRKTCKERYGTENSFQSEIVKQKYRQNNIKKYGVEYPAQLRYVKEKAKQTCLEKYGRYPITYNKYEFDNEKFDSSFELAYYIWLKDNNINFEFHPNIFFPYEYNGIIHSYYPDFIVDGSITEIKGSQFFENGRMINPYDRSQDDLYNAKYQCMLKNGINIITDCSKYIDYVNTKYTTDFIPLFKKDLPFPYPCYTIIQKFHPSIYDAHRNNSLSIKEAWLDKNLIYKCALNRLKYINHCTPADIVEGFNVTKIAPKVSVFKHKLAKRLVNLYLNEYSEVFDPFSGFSGRMLGVTACGKKYIGQDINKTHVIESNNMLNALKLNATVTCKDLFESYGSYECLFTCPPYGLKEIWNENEDNLTCDQWITECIKRFSCNRYLFVVDNTELYKDNIVETLINKSHFGTNHEYVVLIEKSEKIKK